MTFTTEQLRAIWEALAAYVENCDCADDDVSPPDDLEHARAALAMLDAWVAGGADVVAP